MSARLFSRFANSTCQASWSCQQRRVPDDTDGNSDAWSDAAACDSGRSLMRDVAESSLGTSQRKMVRSAASSASMLQVHYCCNGFFSTPTWRENSRHSTTTANSHRSPGRPPTTAQMPPPCAPRALFSQDHCSGSTCLYSHVRAEGFKTSAGRRPTRPLAQASQTGPETRPRTDPRTSWDRSRGWTGPRNPLFVGGGAA